MDLIVDAIGSFLLQQNPNLALIFAVLGSLVTVASAIDAIIPSHFDNDLVLKFLDQPVIKNVAKFLKRFSLLRYKKDNE